MQLFICVRLKPDFFSGMMNEKEDPSNLMTAARPDSCKPEKRSAP